MADELEAFRQMVTGKQHAKRAGAAAPMEGVVLAVDGTTALVVPAATNAYDSDQRFGPMPFGRTSTPPQVGDRCVVLFIGPGISRPWLLSWAAPE